MPPTLDLVLRRVDRVLTTPLPVIPLQLGDRGERMLLGGLVVLGALWCLHEPALAALPARVVHVPEAGWVDAASIPGLPGGVQDGDRLRLTVVGRPIREEGEGSLPVDDQRGAPPVVGSGPAAAVGEIGASPEPAHAAALGQKVSLNHASQAELESLPGVGPSLAGRIVAGRPYTSVRELERVRGIGAKTRAKLAPLVEP